jgi:hypothetical protein
MRSGPAFRLHGWNGRNALHCSTFYDFPIHDRKPTMTVLRLVTSRAAPALTLSRIEQVLDMSAVAGDVGGCRCPAHDDRWGTLVMCEIEPGDVAFYCAGGCTETSIREAIERRLLLTASA